MAEKDLTRKAEGKEPHARNGVCWKDGIEIYLLGVGYHDAE